MVPGTPVLLSGRRGTPPTPLGWREVSGHRGHYGQEVDSVRGNYGAHETAEVSDVQRILLVLGGGQGKE